MKPFDATGAFQSIVTQDGLRRLAVRGAGMTVLSQGTAFAGQMVATILMARLLTPRDFGLVTMVTTFSLLLLNCGLNGFTEAVIQRETMDHTLASNLFWINVCLGLCLTIAFAAAGSVLAHLYAEPRVRGVAVAVALSILFNSFSVIHLALLKRAMRFNVVSVNDVTARFISVLLSLALAWAGWGYWALVAGVVAIPSSTFIGSWLACRWIPALPRYDSRTMPAVRFALSTYGRFTANYFTNNLDNLLVGWRLGPGSLGLYKKAYDLFVLPVNQLSAPLTSVAVSTLSRLKTQPSQYRRYFLTAFSLLAFVGMGMGADLTLIGRDLIRLLLGPRWDESGRIFCIFAPGIGLMVLYGTHGWLHLSIGRADRWFRWGLVELSVTSALFVLGLRWAPAGIAAAWVVSFVVLIIPGLWYAAKPIQIGVAPMLAVIWRYALASLVAGCGSAVILRAFALPSNPSSFSTFVRIVVTSSLFTALYGSLVVLLHWGLLPLRQVAMVLSEMLPLSRRPKTSPAIASVGQAEVVLVPTLQKQLTQAGGQL